jgi:hypothetical protein
MLTNLLNKLKIFLGIGIDVTPAPVPEVHVTINNQITDAVTQTPAPVKKPRAPRKSTKKAG